MTGWDWDLVAYVYLAIGIVYGITVAYRMTPDAHKQMAETLDLPDTKKVRRTVYVGGVLVVIISALFWPFMGANDAWTAWRNRKAR
jgi:hypothetical protein